ncbi:SDR family NAD(P)-dependent oxidoreductase [Bradyrhizobium amphicarpaeae]|uniref:KR domain-containing protein n=1 Tax=Bradyrhizobium amphicarpaeae TaxID=1404768 RepID=A0A2U8Q0X8_9BRAD|nr:SDR family NAD(P)-dependent oxidoreductase [Bradyrhizobium amphicarpaeae]AWM03561.1 KR domain-containing protein [Bradyrhizobium amphicarpaeae]
MENSIALVTGTTSGLGYAAARLLAIKGYSQVIVTGRSLAGVQETAAQLAAETTRKVFTPFELDLDKPLSVQSALAALVKRGRPIDFLLLNAGMVPGKARVITAEGIEASQAPLIGHHQLTVGLLRANLLSPNARIVIASAEPARGGVPMFKYTNVPAFAAKYFRDDQTAAVEALIRNGPNVTYAPNNAYADAKLIVAWWVAALARRLPSGMAVYAVSPGASNATNVARNAGPLLKYLMIPIVNLIPGMNQTPETAAGRYLQASEFGTDVSGEFFASAKGKFSGPMEVQRQPHLHNRASQESAWQAVVKVSGIDLSNPSSLSAVS